MDDIKPKGKAKKVQMSAIEIPKVVADGGIEGAKRTSRETATWNPPALIGPDTLIGSDKVMADARGQDLMLNDGYIAGAAHTNRDSIVGTNYLVNSQVDFEMVKQLMETASPAWGSKIKITKDWADKFQTHVERLFNLTSNSQQRWLDASRRNTLTEQLRLAVTTHLITGEVLASVEWIREQGRPFCTAIQMISPSRLSNPDCQSDTALIRGGVERDPNWGRPTAYWIRNGFPLDPFNNDYKWSRIPAAKPWGRKQIIHISEQFAVDQTRGVSELVAAMKEMRITKRFRDVTLQSAVLSATYAAAIETELPREMIAAMMGASTGGANEVVGDAVGSWMHGLGQYQKGHGDIRLDGTKIPVMYPGTKMTTNTIGTPGGIGTGFEESLIRNISATLGMSYEQFSRDFSKTNYSSARASMSETQKRLDSKKKLVADAYATDVFSVWMEEQIANGALPLPKGCSKDDFAAMFYLPMMKEALTSCSWIGASRGQIDELKETQAAILRINNGLSTYEKESARLGEDFRYLFAQRAREEGIMDKLGLEFTGEATKPGANMRQQTMTKNSTSSGSANTEDDKTDNKDDEDESEE